MCRSKHVEQLRNIGIINSTTRSHLVGHFLYELYYDARIHEHQTSICYKVSMLRPLVLLVPAVLKLKLRRK